MFERKFDFGLIHIYILYRTNTTNNQANWTMKIRFRWKLNRIKWDQSNTKQKKPKKAKKKIMKSNTRTRADAPWNALTGTKDLMRAKMVEADSDRMVCLLVCHKQKVVAIWNQIESFKNSFLFCWDCSYPQHKIKTKLFVCECIAWEKKKRTTHQPTENQNTIFILFMFIVVVRF